MATAAQKQAVIDLHETNDRTLNGAEYPADEPYDMDAPVVKTKDDQGNDVVASGDPYELAHAKTA